MGGRNIAMKVPPHQWEASAGIARCDEIEPLAAESSAYWISSPAAIVHLVTEPDPI
jgi:hypothetical protein